VESIFQNKAKAQSGKGIFNRLKNASLIGKLVPLLTNRRAHCATKCSCFSFPSCF